MIFLFGLGSSMVCAAQGFSEYFMKDTLITDCQGILYDSGGPTAAYGHNENITTVIAAGGVVTLTFQGFFQLENNVDFLKIYDGPSIASPLLGQFTGTSVPPTLVANSGYVTLVMTTDNNVAYGGFKMQWTSVQPMPTPPAVSVPVLPSCSSNQLTLHFSTPVQCDWLTTASVTMFQSGQSTTSTSVVGLCDNNGIANDAIVTFSQPFLANCTYHLQLSISIPDNCGVEYSFVISSMFTLSSCPIEAEIIAVDTILCMGNCTPLGAIVMGCGNFTYSWNNGLPATSGPHMVCPTQTTTYTVVVTNINTGASVSVSRTIEVIEAEILTPSQSICQSADDLVMQANTSGNWTGVGLEWGTNIFDPDSALAGINYIYFEKEGCVDSVAITVTPIQAQDSTAACPGTSPFQLIAQPPGGIWNGPHTTAAGIFDPAVIGSYTITYTVNGCVDEVVVNVDTIGNTISLDSLCQSIDYDTLVFSPIGGVWSGLGIVDSLLGVFSPALVNPGMIELTYSIHGCVHTFEVYVKEIQLGNTVQTTCPLQLPAVVYTSQPSPSGGVWSGDGIVDNTTGMFDPSLIADDTWTGVIYQAPNGCSDTIFVYNRQTEVAVDSLMFCLNDAAVELNETLLEAIEPWDGAWSGPGISTNNGSWYFDPAIAGVGVHTIIYTNNTCQDFVTVIVYDDDLPDLPFEFCSTNPEGILVPNWLPGGYWWGVGITDSVLGKFNPAIADEGSYYVYWQSPAGCMDSIAVTVEVFEAAQLSGLESAYCSSTDEILFSATPAGGTLSGDFIDYSFIPAELAPGAYQAIYTVQGVICPSSTDAVTVNIYPPLTATLTISDDTLCPGQSVNLTVNAVGGNAVNGYQYLWSNGGAPIATNTSTPSVNTVITVEVSDGCSTPVVLSASIEVLPSIDVVTTSSDAVCSSEIGWATAEILSQGNYTMAWNGIYQDTVFAQAGTIQTLVVTDVDNGCTYTENVIIDNLPIVSAAFILVPGGECITIEDQDNVSIIDISQNGVTGLWEFGNGETLAYSSGQSITQSYPGPGSYTITLTLQNASGCESIASQQLCILSENPVFIPDIFSPNGDGNNDVLKVRGFGLRKIDFKIYNRWGEEVFSTKTADIGWDGNYRGMPAPSGSYVFTFFARMGETVIEKQGEIVLVR